MVAVHLLPFSTSAAAVLTVLVVMPVPPLKMEKLTTMLLHHLLVSEDGNARQVALACSFNTTSTGMGAGWMQDANGRISSLMARTDE